jgi:hypothetical protein
VTITEHTKVFVSYRRSDTAAVAGDIHRALADAFGEKRVFQDLQIDPGEAYPERLIGELNDSSIVVVVVGDDWVTAKATWGVRRIDQDHDWVRREVRTALDQDKLVVPVLVEGATLPSEQEQKVLPSDIRQLIFRQAVKYRHADRNSDLKELIRFLAAKTGWSPAKRRQQRPDEVPKPARADIKRKFDEELKEHPVNDWSVKGLRDTADGVPRAGGLVFLVNRLESAARALEVQSLLVAGYGWQKVDSAARAAWRHLSTEPAPIALFDYFDTLARRHSTSETGNRQGHDALIDFAVRIASIADPDGFETEVEQWPTRSDLEGAELARAVNGLSAARAPVRLEIDLATESTFQVDDQPTRRAVGLLFRGDDDQVGAIEKTVDELVSEEPERPTPEALLAAVFEEADAMIHDIEHVDVVIGAIDLPHLDAPHVRYVDEDSAPTQMGRHLDIVSRSGDRRYARRRTSVPTSSPPGERPSWIDPPEGGEELVNAINDCGHTLCLRSRPDAVQVWRILARRTLYLAWHRESDVVDEGETERIENAWSGLPQNLLPKSAQHEAACGLAALWHDPHWVDNYEQIDHRP